MPCGVPLRGINQLGDGYATTLSSCEANRAVVAADIEALVDSPMVE